MRLRGLATKRDGSVVIIVPSPRAVSLLRTGGGIDTEFTWRDGFKAWLSGRFPAVSLAYWWLKNRIPLPIAKAWEAEKFIRDPYWRADKSPAQRQELARRWVEALDKGGLCERDAVALILEKDAPAHSTALEVVDVSELPPDRTYRNAWTRSHNGGPIMIDETKAEAIMWELYHAQRA